MLTSRLRSIPRFALPYSKSLFASGFRALFGAVQPPDTFDILGKSPKFWTSSGRQALRLLLTALDLEPGSGVALPLFTDPSLVNAIAAAGHRPVFIDVHPLSLTMDPKSLVAAAGQFSAVVIVHLFGHLADIPQLLAAAGNVPVIEDTAHAPLSFLNGRMAGEFGVASFYSFASTKYWPAGGGGLVAVHEPELARRMARAVDGLQPPSFAREAPALFMQAAKAIVFRPRWYGILGKPFRRWAEDWALLEPQLDGSAIQRPHAAVARRQAELITLRVEQQRANSRRLLTLLETVDDVVLPRERFGARYNYHLFPVLLRDPAERAAIAEAMWMEYVDTSTIYSGSIDAARKRGYRGGCPVAESVAGRLLTLPNYATMTGDEIEIVAQLFIASVKAWRSKRPSYPFVNYMTRSRGNGEALASPAAPPANRG
jgi:dTDP-4-amino-4,6-dideoxygalactose transaminase